MSIAVMKLWTKMYAIQAAFFDKTTDTLGDFHKLWIQEDAYVHSYNIFLLYNIVQ
jgi:hypothetical protein